MSVVRARKPSAALGGSLRFSAFKTAFDAEIVRDPPRAAEDILLRLFVANFAEL
jgi:hypothetical protein